VHYKKKDPANKVIVEQYFKRLQNKDIEGLKDLFWSDAIVYEPFSKLEQGLRGWTQIEPFLKVAIMASESLSRKVAFEGSDKILNNDLPDPKVDNINNYDIVETFVTFQKDNIIKARFRFELSNHANIMDNIDQKKIKALNIQLI
jgi:hypothetical protein